MVNQYQTMVVAEIASATGFSVSHVKHIHSDFRRNGLKALTSKGIITRLSPLKEHVLTLTSDNGREFAHHQKISNKLEADFYFATLTKAKVQRVEDLYQSN